VRSAGGARWRAPGGRMSSLRTGAIGDGLIRPGPGVPTVRPGGACACPTGPATTTGSGASGFLTRPRERESSGSGDAGAEMTGVDSTFPRRTLRRSIRPRRATLRSLTQPNGVDGGTARAVPELPSPPCDRGTGRRHRCRTARRPPKRPMQSEETVVFARRTILRSCFPWVRLAAMLPVNGASIPHGDRAAIPFWGSRLSWSRAVP
jgi:hypothetical protein